MTRIQYFSFVGILCTVLGFSQAATAQLNFSVGFTSGRIFSDSLNSIVSDYTESKNFEFEEALEPVRWLNGVNLGFRQKYDNLALSVSWTNLRRTKSGYGEDLNNELFEKQLKYTLNSYDIGLENYVGIFSYGFTIGQRSFDIKTPISDSDKESVVSSDSQWISRFHVAINSKGGGFSSIALKPYFEYALGNNDLSDLKNELLGTKSVVKDRIPLVGISVIFYNGRQ